MENYGLLTNMAQGIREGMNTFMTLKNQKRQEDQLNGQLMQHGLIKGEDGQYQFSPEEQQKRSLQSQMLQQQATAATEGAKPDSDRSRQAQGIIEKSLKMKPGELAGYSEQQLKEFSPNLIGGQKIDLTTAVLNNRNVNQERSYDLRSESMNLNNHQKALRSITEDKQLNPLLTSYQNLENAKQNFIKGGATTQEFAELQQAVRSNAGIKGQSGVSERSDTYLKSMGINKDKFMQFITGDPQSVLKSDPKFAEQILGLVELEQENKRKQAMAQLDKKAAGFKTFYSRPGMEDYASDFQNTVDQFRSQFVGHKKESGGGGLIGKDAKGGPAKAESEKLLEKYGF